MGFFESHHFNITRCPIFKVLIFGVMSSHSTLAFPYNQIILAEPSILMLLGYI
ncbi:hypothetical protein VDIAB_270776 [Vibrio diabolicus]|nr:hypothetical protein VDIAB_270776 [Vibrio diabolicus]